MRIRWRIAVVIAVSLIAIWITRAYAWHLTFVDLSGVPWGLFRFSLTPRPWATEPNYSFLIVPAIVHWLLFIPAVMAGVALWLRRPLARLPLTYLVVVITLFAAVPAVQGPRHRVQILPLIVWLQFQSVWWLLALPQRRPLRSREPDRNALARRRGFDADALGHLPAPSGWFQHDIEGKNF